MSESERIKTACTVSIAKASYTAFISAPRTAWVSQDPSCAKGCIALHQFLPNKNLFARPNYFVPPHVSSRLHKHIQVPASFQLSKVGSSLKSWSARVHRRCSNLLFPAKFRPCIACWGLVSSRGTYRYRTNRPSSFSMPIPFLLLLTRALHREFRAPQTLPA